MAAHETEVKDPDAAEPADSERVPASDSRYRRLVESLEDYAVTFLDPQGCIVTWNRGGERITGYSADEILGHHFSIFYTPESVAVGHPESELEMAQAMGRYSEEGWRVCKDGRRFWANVAITAMRHPDGSLEGYGKIARDLTEHKQGEQQATNTMALLRTSVLTDPLTGVLNRRALDQALIAAIKVGRPFCVAMLDLDHFKEVNDRLGHAVGDNFLRQATVAWRHALRHDDLLARYGGEEFTLVLPGCDLAAGIATTERIRTQTPSECTCSAGVAAWSPGMTGDDVLSTADRALYEAKAHGRNCVWPTPAAAVPAPDA